MEINGDVIRRTWIPSQEDQGEEVHFFFWGGYFFHLLLLWSGQVSERPLCLPPPFPFTQLSPPLLYPLVGFEGGDRHGVCVFG